MSRADDHADAMLRHLGSAYYATLRGEGSPEEVRQAVDRVAASEEAHRGVLHVGSADRSQRRRHGRWRVRDVMTTDVVAVTTETPYKDLARLMSAHKVNALPVLDRHRQVVGVVSEADLLRKAERGPTLSVRPWPTRRERAQAGARKAAELMTSPAVTVHPDVRLGLAARLMNARHLRRLPAVDDSGELVGIVTRRDLISVFLREDAEIAAEVEEVLTDILLVPREAVRVSVLDGTVSLSGSVADPSQVSTATRLAQDVDGVVAVNSELTVSPLTTDQRKSVRPG